jgi:hypothetical protein
MRGFPDTGLTAAAASASARVPSPLCLAGDAAALCGRVCGSERMPARQAAGGVAGGSLSSTASPRLLSSGTAAVTSRRTTDGVRSTLLSPPCRLSKPFWRRFSLSSCGNVPRAGRGQGTAVGFLSSHAPVVYPAAPLCSAC